MLSKNQSSVEKSIQKLSSGLRINGAADDAAGLAISEKMRSQIRGLGQAESNAQDGISLLQTAEGALQQTTDILQRMRELVIKAQNTGVLTEDDKVSINTEMGTLRDEIDRIASSTTFNSKKLLDGSLATKIDSGGTTVSTAIAIGVSNARADTTYTVSVADGFATVQWSGGNEKVAVATTVSGRISFMNTGITMDTGEEEVAATLLAGTIKTLDSTHGDKADFKIGANTYDEDMLSAGIGDMSAKGLNREDETERISIDVNTPTTSNETLAAIDYAISKVSSQRATLGAMQNRMEYAIDSLSVTQENLNAAESRIRDVDMAKEMVNYTKDSILNQAAMAMLSQANQQPQAILTLLQL